MLTVGSPLPPVVLPNQDGELVDLAQMKGKRVLIFFYPKVGIVRSAFLIDPTSVVEQAWYKISPSDTSKKLLEAVGK